MIILKILGVIGSKRKKGNTSTLVKEVLKSACSVNKEIETNIIYLGDYNIKGCYGCEGCKDNYKCVIKDDMQKIYPLIMEADALVLGSPTYFYNITADTKAFLERCYNYEVFAEDDRSVWMSINEVKGIKYAITVAVCEQQDEGDMGFTSDAMNKPLEALGYRVVDAVKILKLYELGAAEKENKALQQAKEAGARLAKTLQLRKEIEKRI